MTATVSPMLVSVSNARSATTISILFSATPRVRRDFNGRPSNVTSRSKRHRRRGSPRPRAARRRRLGRRRTARLPRARRARRCGATRRAPAAAALCGAEAVGGLRPLAATERDDDRRGEGAAGAPRPGSATSRGDEQRERDHRRLGRDHRARDGPPRAPQTEAAQRGLRQASGARSLPSTASANTPAVTSWLVRRHRARGAAARDRAAERRPSGPRRQQYWYEVRFRQRSILAARARVLLGSELEQDRAEHLQASTPWVRGGSLGPRYAPTYAPAVRLRNPLWRRALVGRVRAFLVGHSECVFSRLAVPAIAFAIAFSAADACGQDRTDVIVEGLKGRRCGPATRSRAGSDGDRAGWCARRGVAVPDLPRRGAVPERRRHRQRRGPARAAA